jgi:hypothetical protein
MAAPLKHAGSVVARATHFIGRDMPIRREAFFLRARASRLREIAGTARTALSDQLRVMAEEQEARADELDRA